MDNYFYFWLEVCTYKEYNTKGFEKGCDNIKDINDLFELMTKMYAEITAIKKGNKEHREETLKKFEKLDGELTKISTVIENNIKPNIKLSLDGYHDTNERLTRLEEKIDNISEKVDRHEIQIKVMEGGGFLNKKSLQA